MYEEKSAGALREVLQETQSPIILDPVLASSSGHRFVDPSQLAELQALARAATLITPNTGELEVLLEGQPPLAWAQLTGTAVLHTGGHSSGDRIEDVLHMPDGRVLATAHARVDSRATHGTGCTLSAAVTAGMARGWPLDRAVDAAIAATAQLIALSKDHEKARSPGDRKLAPSPGFHEQGLQTPTAAAREGVYSPPRLQKLQLRRCKPPLCRA